MKKKTQAKEPIKFGFYLWIIGALLIGALSMNSINEYRHMMEHGTGLYEEGHHEMEHHHAHKHETIEINSENAPSVKLEIYEDAKSGYNVFINTTNFEFAPQSANEAHVEGQGHAHMYVNGKKTRVYGNWVYISRLRDGSNLIEVTLNTNDHKDIMANGELVKDSIEITQ